MEGEKEMKELPNFNKLIEKLIIIFKERVPNKPYFVSLTLFDDNDYEIRVDYRQPVFDNNLGKINFKEDMIVSSLFYVNTTSRGESLTFNYYCNHADVVSNQTLDCKLLLDKDEGTILRW